MRECFFERELAGEPPLERLTAERLVAVSQRLADRKFWNELREEQVVVMTGESGKLYLQVMGVAGEHRAINVYRGARGLRYLNDLMEMSFEWPGETLVGHDLLAVEFTSRRDLRPADRELLDALEVPKKRGALMPSFSSRRPGFHIWYVNEPEGRELAAALELLERFLLQLAKSPQKAKL